MKNLEWVIKLVDQVSSPVQGMVSELGNMQQDLYKSTAGVDKIGLSIDGLGDHLTSLKADRNGSFSTSEIKQYNKEIDETERKLRDLEGLPNAAASAANWGEMATGMNQSFELAEKLSGALSFTTEIKALSTDVQRLTDLTGKDLDMFVEKSYTIGEVFGKDSQEIAKAANAMTQQMGGSFASNLNILEQGFEKGGDLNGDMLTQMSEYSAHLQGIGLDAEKSMAFMIQANKLGIFSDKAIDSLKEGGFSLKEMGKAQQEALAGIGLSEDDIVGKSAFEAIRTVSAAMEGMGTQAKQMALTDIFKGAGEDGGLAFIEKIAGMNLDLQQLTSYEQQGSAFKEFFAGLKVSVANTVGGAKPWIDTLGSVGLAMMSVGQVSSMLGFKISHLSKITKVLNVVMKANPMGMVAVGIAALSAAAVVAYQKVDWFRGSVQGAWEGLKVFATVMYDSFISSIKNLISGLSGLAGALGHLMSGELSEAKATGLAAMADLANANPLLEIGKGAYENAEKIGAAVSSGYAKGVAELATPITGAFHEQKTADTSLLGKEKEGKEGEGSGLANGASNVAQSIISGGERKQVLNIYIEKVLEMGDQIVNDPSASAGELVDTIIEQLTRRMSGAFKTAAQ